MTQDVTYFKWACTRVARFMVKALLLYPVMLALLIPYEVYTLCLIVRNKLEGWWWE